MKILFIPVLLTAATLFLGACSTNSSTDGADMRAATGTTGAGGTGAGGATGGGAGSGGTGVGGTTNR